MKTFIAVITTILIMLQVFYYAMINATIYFYHNVQGGMCCDIDLGLQRFNYWEGCENDYRIRGNKNEY